MAFFGGTTPKIAHYFCQDALAPLHACLLFERLTVVEEDAVWPVFLLDDSGALADTEWTVRVRAYDGALQEIARREYHGSGRIEQPRRLGEFALAASQTLAVPLLLVVEVLQVTEVVDRSFYWLNAEVVKDSLFSLPATCLASALGQDTITVTNIGALPAVGVHLSCQECSDTFQVEDGYFWLDPGEIRIVSANHTNGITVAAWNAEECVAQPNG